MIILARTGDGDQSQVGCRAASTHRSTTPPAQARDRRPPGSGAGAACCGQRWRGAFDGAGDRRSARPARGRRRLPIEIDYGDWDGVALRDAAAEWAVAGGPPFALPGGESLVADGALAPFCTEVPWRDGAVVARPRRRPAAVCCRRHRRGAPWRVQLGVAAVTHGAALTAPHLHCSMKPPRSCGLLRLPPERVARIRRFRLICGTTGADWTGMLRRGLRRGRGHRWRRRRSAPRPTAATACRALRAARIVPAERPIVVSSCRR